MLRFPLVYTLIALILIFTSACNGENATPEDNHEYEATKKMMVDILQTEDGKKALTEIMNDEDMKKQLVIESDVVKQAINDAFTSEESQEMWINLFNDSTFIENFASSMEEEHMKLTKKLMNDSEYQQQMLELLQNPEITEQMLTLLKSQQFRSHLEETIQQTLETPLFQEKISELLLEAAEKEQDQQEEDDEESDDENNEANEDEANEESDDTEENNH